MQIMTGLKMGTVRTQGVLDYHGTEIIHIEESTPTPYFLIVNCTCTV
jgi:hypothetical protein